MKISELSTDRAADVLCEITPYLASLTSDTELAAAFRGKLPAGCSVAEIYLHGSKILTKIIPIVLKTHRDDVFGVLSVLNGKTSDEIAKQNILTTTRQIIDAVKDKELRDFFKSLQSEGETE